MRVKIPLTLAIIPALIVTCGGDRYAIPQVSLLELVRLEADEVSKGIEMVHGAPVYRLRGRLLPLVYLETANCKIQEDDVQSGQAKVTAASTSWCCRPTSGSSGWWSMRSTTPKRSWSSRCANS